MRLQQSVPLVEGRALFTKSHRRSLYLSQERERERGLGLSIHKELDVELTVTVRPVQDEKMQMMVP